MQRIAEYEIRDCGVDHAQYFQGVGTSFTEWEHVALGAGNNAKEAYEDAVEQLAMSDWDTAKMPKRPRGIRVRDKVPAQPEDGELYYYVAIYVR